MATGANLGVLFRNQTRMTVIHTWFFGTRIPANSSVLSVFVLWSKLYLFWSKSPTIIYAILVLVCIYYHFVILPWIVLCLYPTCLYLSAQIDVSLGGMQSMHLLMFSMAATKMEVMEHVTVATCWLLLHPSKVVAGRQPLSPPHVASSANTLDCFSDYSCPCVSLQEQTV